MWQCQNRPVAKLPDLPRIYADFNGLITARPYRVLLRATGTREDLERQGLGFEEGLRVLFYDVDATEGRDRDDLLAVGVITRHERWGWIGLIEGELLHKSEWDAADDPPGH
jgi:hypothetical protein